MTLREPTADRPRLRAALGPKLLEIPAPVVELRLEAVELSESVGQQLELVKPVGDEMQARLSDGLRQVRASTGSGSVGRSRGGGAVVADPRNPVALRAARRVTRA